MGMHVGDERHCMFCKRTNHQAKDCRDAVKWSFDEKRKLLRKFGRCFICIGYHRADECRLKDKIKCRNCGHAHVEILCRGSSSRATGGNATPLRNPREGISHVSKKARQEEKEVTSMSNQVSVGDVCLQTLKVKLLYNNQERFARVLLDTASSRSYIRKNMINDLKLSPVRGPGEEAMHATFGGGLSKPVQHKLYDLQLSGTTGDVKARVILRDQEPICRPIKNLDRLLVDMKDELTQKGVWLSDTGSSSEIEVLIGADLYGKIITGNIVQLSNNLTAIETVFGWTLLGEVSKKVRRIVTNVALANNCITDLWELETLGIQDLTAVLNQNQRDEKAKEQFLQTITRNGDGRYVIRLPWKEGHPELYNHKDIAKRRLLNTSQDLAKNKLLGVYNSLFTSWENEDFIEEVTGEGKHYLPHRAVIKSDSATTPVRPVFDASCKRRGGVSLNDCLHKGTSYVQLIPAVLLKFREKKIGFVSDIRKAFQMIEVHEDDRDFLRFLWWKNKDRLETKEYRHMRVPFGATCSPFILGAVLEFHLKNVGVEDKETAKKLWNSLYVDNCCSSTDTYNDYEFFRRKSVDILQRAKMDLRMWLNNVDEVDNVESQHVSVLGLKWNRKDDVLYVNTEKIQLPEVCTKRTVLSVISKVFDPIGFTSPVVLPMKVLLQRAWVNKVKWDSPLPEAESVKFLQWCEQMVRINELRIPRSLGNGDCTSAEGELHTFSDGSKIAFGAVSFFRTVRSDGNYVIKLVGAKSRVAPLKHMTIPRMELMGGVIGTRMANAIKAGLGNTNLKQFYWTDSTTLLAWIGRNNQFGTFVGNRIKEIRELTNVDNWHFVPGTLNPADVPSRGSTLDDLIRSKWTDGPEWLKLPESCWPCANIKYNEDEIQAEIKKTSVETTLFNAELNFQKDFSYNRVVRIHAWVRRFIFNCKNREQKRTGVLSGLERKRAEIDVILTIQKDAFENDPLHDSLTQLEVFKDEFGVICVKTKLTYLKEDQSFKFPPVLPGKHETVKRLILDTHNSYCHAGVGFVVIKLRRKFWILKGRQRVRNIVSRCYRCRRYSAKSATAESAPLPLGRIKTSDVFETIGVDLAGPFHLKTGKKAWLVLYTCAVYRAVHLDLVNAISTVVFINSLKRFIEKYRRPVTIFSDNGTNFRGTDNLFRLIDWKKVLELEQVSKIEWRFNPPTAAWWGGWWERLIRIVKDLLRKELGCALLRQEELKTVVHRVEDIMNSRPLTYISEDPNDLEPLTPYHFLRPLGVCRFPELAVLSGEDMRARYKMMTAMQSAIKTRFLNEYVGMLINRPSKHKGKQLAVGELVWIGQDNAKRGRWLMGRVLELIPGADGVCRVAKLKTKDGMLTRAVQRLYPLEADQVNAEPVVEELRSSYGRLLKRPRRLQ